MRAELLRLTGAKVVVNTALRWIPPFLPTLERAFGATTTQLTTALGVGELAGLSTLAVGPALDRHRERAVMIAALGSVAASALVALTGTVPAFTLSVVLLVIGVANFTVAGHAWISHRVDYRWRARAIGVFETSWALALLVGAPIVALLINGIGWRAPFVAVALATAVTAVVVVLTLPRHRPSGHADRPAPPASKTDGRINGRAVAVLFASALLAGAGLSVFVVSGAWLEDAFGVSTGGLGTIAMMFGAFELAGSSSTAAFGDRLGKTRSTLGGIVLLGAGLVVMLAAGDRLGVGVVGLLLFLLGFEYGFVSSLSLVSEAMPAARGRTLALGNAIGTGARGAATIASGWLYGIHGIGGTATLSAAAGGGALVCLVLSRSPRARPGRPRS